MHTRNKPQPVDVPDVEPFGQPKPFEELMGYPIDVEEKLFIADNGPLSDYPIDIQMTSTEGYADSSSTPLFTWKRFFLILLLIISIISLIYAIKCMRK